MKTRNKQSNCRISANVDGVTPQLRSYPAQTETTSAEKRKLGLLFRCARPANAILESYLGIKKLRDAAQNLREMVHSNKRVDNPCAPDFEIRRCDLRTLRALEKILKEFDYRRGQCPDVHVSGAGGELWIAQQMRNLLASVPFVTLSHNYVVLESAGTTFWYDKRLATKWRENYALLALHSVGDGSNSDYPFHDLNIDLAMKKRPQGAFYEIVLSRKVDVNSLLLYKWSHESGKVPVELFAQKRNAWATALISSVEIWNCGDDRHEFYPLKITHCDSWLVEEMSEFSEETDASRRFDELLDCFYLLVMTSDYNKFLDGFARLIHLLYVQAPEFTYSDKEMCLAWGLRWLKKQNERDRYVAPVLTSQLVSLLYDLHSMFDTGREGTLWFDHEEPDWKTVLSDFHKRVFDAIGKE